MKTPSVIDCRPVVIFGTQRSASLARFCLTHDSPFKVIAFTNFFVIATGAIVVDRVPNALKLG